MTQEESLETNPTSPVSCLMSGRMNSQVSWFLSYIPISHLLSSCFLVLVICLIWTSVIARQALVGAEGVLGGFSITVPMAQLTVHNGLGTRYTGFPVWWAPS